MDDDGISKLTAFMLGISLGALITLSLLFLASSIWKVEQLHQAKEEHHAI